MALRVALQGYTENMELPHLVLLAAASSIKLCPSALKGRTNKCYFTCLVCLLISYSVQFLLQLNLKWLLWEVLLLCRCSPEQLAFMHPIMISG